ncbi:MAG TPA: PilZ domain-containing protein [Clostridia bacterium]|nr:PilZ domain-containing protein [Clostridia bacterium]
MSRQKTDYLALLHFSKSKPLTCSLVSGTIDNFFTVKLNEPMDPFNNISKGDPVTFGKIDKEDKGNEVKIFGGFVLSKADEDELTISPDMTSFAVERRRSTRHPVSIFGYIKHGLRKENLSSICIKDISYDGLRICSETELQVEDSVEVNICIFDNVLNIDGTVVRKRSMFGKSEYGIQLEFKYKNMVFNIRDYVDNLVTQERRLLENHLIAMDHL